MGCCEAHPLTIATYRMQDYATCTGSMMLVHRDTGDNHGAEPREQQLHAKTVVLRGPSTSRACISRATLLVHRVCIRLS